MKVGGGVALTTKKRHILLAKGRRISLVVDNTGVWASLHASPRAKK